LAQPRANLIPARARLDGEEKLELFVRMAKAVQTDVERLAQIGDVATAVTRYLRFHNLPQRLVAVPDPLLDRAGFDRQPLMQVRRGTASADDAVGLTVADAGVAETGTLVLASSPLRPTMVAFLPETLAVVLPTADVVGAYEDAWAKIRAAGSPPRSVNFITGPSRTGDIGQQITLGAHGPRRLLVLLVESLDGP
jgi:L-lactate dehydrogenase complex protein LldG